MKRAILGILTLCGFWASVSKEAAALPGYRGMTLAADVSAADIADLRTLGANLIKYPLICGAACDSLDRAGYEAWLESALVRFETVVLPAAQANGMKVLLSLNSSPGGYTQLRPKPLIRIFTDQWAQDSFLALWPAIAQRYVGNSTIIAYDLCSEPARSRAPAAGLLDWHELAARATASIRAIDSTKKVITEPYFGAPENLKRLSLPVGDNVALGFNMYFPLNFTHQGLDRFANKPVKYPNKKLTRKNVFSRLNLVKTYLRKKKLLNTVPVHVGEFTVTRFAGKNGIRYLTDLMNYFERANWGWTYHAWREATVWSVEHSEDENDPNKSATPTQRQLLFERFFGRNQF
jgi:hypothetical protein